MTNRQSGIALVLVLGTVLIVSASALGIARAVVVSRTSARSGADAKHAEDLALACDAWLRRWITSEGSAVVLDPAATVPMVNVGFIEGHIGGQSFRIDAAAFDQDGMASVSEAVGQGPLAAGLPEKVRAAVVKAAAKTAEISGLDQLDRPPPGLSIFPRRFGDHAQTSIAAHVALPSPRRLRVNLNTAPIERIAATYRALSISGIEQVIDARARRVPMTVAPSIEAREGNDQLPLPVIESTAWAFLLDVTLGQVKRAWWCVYRVDGPGGFALIQRLVIDE